MRTIFSESPRYLDDSVEADTLKKVVLHSAARGERERDTIQYIMYSITQKL